MIKNNKKFAPRQQKKALNVVEQVGESKYQVYQLYGPMKIPLLGHRSRGEFVEDTAKTIDEAFERLYKEYYE